MKLLTIFLLVLFNIIYSRQIQGQAYIPFSEDDSTEWIMQHTVNKSGTCDESFFFRYVLEGDTTIASILYRKIYVRNLTLAYNNAGLLGCSYPPVNGYAGGFREDTISKKCYVVLPDSSSDTLIYDFNLIVGDTIYSYAMPPSFPCPDVNTLTSVDSVNIGGFYHRKLSFCAGYYSVVEGVGANRDPFGVSPYIGYTVVECVRHGSSVYPTFGSPYCQLFLNTEELLLEQPQINIYPNPTLIEFSIESSLPIDRIEVFDSYQKLVLEILYKGAPIRLSDHVNGFYLVRIFSKNQIYVKKLFIY